VTVKIPIALLRISYRIFHKSGGCAGYEEEEEDGDGDGDGGDGSHNNGATCTARGPSTRFSVAVAHRNKKHMIYTMHVFHANISRKLLGLPHSFRRLRPLCLSLAQHSAAKNTSKALNPSSLFFSSCPDAERLFPFPCHEGQPRYLATPVRHPFVPFSATRKTSFRLPSFSSS
jgi:hypothetical protein